VLHQAGTIAARLSHLVFILILVFVDPSPATLPAEGKARKHFLQSKVMEIITKNVSCSGVEAG
jgi:hypothetical protein